MALNPFESRPLDKPAKPTKYARTGHSYIAQLEHDYLFAHKLTLCNNCFRLGTDVSMKRCQGCQLNDYCSKECQRIKWRQHKAYCNLIQGKGAKNAYLSAMEQQMVFKVVIDSYRLRCEVDHHVRGEDHGIYFPGKWDEGIVWVKDDVVADFQRYLDLVDEAKVLPDWWGFESRMELMCLAIDRENKENIYTKIDQDALIPRYDGDTQIRNALCVVAELAVGYDGKGAPNDDGEWFEGFVKYLSGNPEEKEKLLRESKETVETSMKSLGRSLPSATESSKG